VNQLTHFVFADAECRRAIKRTKHDLSQAVPHYSSCVTARDDPHQVYLTVCHNAEEQEGPVPPPVAY
jgi:hypothetical protein